MGAHFKAKKHGIWKIFREQSLRLMEIEIYLLDRKIAVRPHEKYILFIVICEV